MTRGLTLAIAFPCLPSLSYAQVDFSGEWELVEASGPSAPVNLAMNSPLERGGRIVQTERRITITPATPLNPNGLPHVFATIGTTVTVRPNISAVNGNTLLRDSFNSKWMGPVLLITWTTLDEPDSVRGTGGDRKPATSVLNPFMTMSINPRGQLEILGVDINMANSKTAFTSRLVYQRKD